MRFLKKSTSIILALSMLLVCSVNVFASNSADSVSPITISRVDYNNSAVANCVQFTANYTVSGATPKYITVLFSSEAIDSNNFDSTDILYIDQKEYATNSTSCNFLVETAKLESGKNYYYYMGGTDIDTAAKFDKTYSEGGEVIPPVPTGVALTGTVISWNDTADAKVYLYASDATTTEILADLALETPTSNKLYKAATLASTAVAVDKKYSIEFTFKDVAAGNYKLAVYKPDQEAGRPYAPVITDVTVEDSAVAVGEIVMYLRGDVNDDGNVTGRDVTALRNYIVNEVAKVPVSLLDFNKDDNVSGRDVTFLRKVIVGDNTLD